MKIFRRPETSLLILALILGWMAPLCQAQYNDYKRPLEHEDYEKWNSITGRSLSRDGNWIMYTIRSGDEKSTLHIRHAKSNKQYDISNASSARFTFDNQYAIFRVSPDADLMKKLRKEKRKPEEMPQVKLQILNLKSGSLDTMERTRSFATPEENADWLAVLLDKPFEQKTVQQTKSDVNETYEVTEEGLQRPIKKKTFGQTSSESKKEKPAATEGKEKSAKPAKSDAKKPAKKSDKKKSEGTTLVLRNLTTGAERRFPNVTSYRFSKHGSRLAFTTSTKNDGDRDGVTVIDLDKESQTQIAKGLGNYRNLTFSVDEKQLTFTTDREDYESKTSAISIFHWKAGQKEAKAIVTPDSEGIPKDWWIATSPSLTFSEDLSRMYFNTAPKPEDLNKEKDAEDEEPKAKLDLWHWKDPQLQPQQLLQASQERNRSYRAAYDLKSKKVVQLATLEMPVVSVDTKSKASIALAVTNMRYRKMMSWDYPGFQDTYLVDLKSGKARLLLEAERTGGSLSPDAQFVTWWNSESKSYFAMSTEEGSKPVEISADIPHSLANELHDTPSPVRPYGAAGWLPGDSGLLVYDRFDIWKLDPTGKEAPICVTGGVGRENQIRFRYVRTDPEARHVDPKSKLYLSAFNEATKASGYYTWDLNPAEQDESGPSVNMLIMLDESISRFTKAEDSDAILFTRSTYRRFPDLWYSNLSFDKIQRISDANPQQSEYTWGSAELVHWDATDGQKLDGLLYKPENFDPNKKYPMMVYFYERNSDNLHSYHAPAAGRSIINFSFYVSRGYVLFVPDIPYKTGEPGPSAANAILPGVQSIVKHGYIDEKRIGTQGHSWGGYQTAYLVTQTDMFACAESGAPVSNMTSAYGGIRWGSGMSRMFQYERTQSRIGEDLWSARDKYLANSPVFFADKINTPLLILHNDEDGAVPWYQGIELFVAMRRLEKPAWLMNYNGEPHWVMKKENRLDFAIRMQQFFDHYLMDEPMPEWMATGIPAVDKGKKFGLEPAKVQPAAETENVETEEAESSAETSSE